MSIESVILQPSHPFFVSILVFVFDQLVLFANYCVIANKFYLNRAAWLLTLIMSPVSVVLVLYFEFTAGGYSSSDMMAYGLGTFWLLVLFLLPLFKLIKDFERRKIAD